ncbi:hypothetical protein P7K49_007331 [Saguinus oedipus]|uniref:Uncharacterized protein n=1 Tax=Saguinus oedipus TaxID=9490 RepID=A0ABQ9VV45_SAGOE|nr:hypothetical protein P7K49_007331 [Saguinus oedipus]
MIWNYVDMGSIDERITVVYSALLTLFDSLASFSSKHRLDDFCRLRMVQGETDRASLAWRPIQLLNRQACADATGMGTARINLTKAGNVMGKQRICPVLSTLRSYRVTVVNAQSRDWSPLLQNHNQTRELILSTWEGGYNLQCQDLTSAGEADIRVQFVLTITHTMSAVVKPCGFPFGCLIFQSSYMLTMYLYHATKV